MKTQSLTLIAFSSVVAVLAGPRQSADYSIAAESANSGGARSTSISYSHDGSLGGIVGVSTVATPTETAKHGYLGQLYEVTGLALNSTPASIDETATRQLAAWKALDDDSYLAVNAAAVAWSVVTGPLTGISSAGLATAGTVYQDTSATVQGSHGGLEDQFELTVRDVDSDNFGSYAGDQLDDDWQVGFFGAPPNLYAGPLLDPDGDGQNNRFEFTAGVIPTDPLSRFLLRVEPVAGQPAQKRLIFSPRFTDRTYDIFTSTTLQADTWTTLSDGIVSDNGKERTVIDPNATEGKKFYRVQVTKP
jgi:hypothetical protein